MYSAGLVQAMDRHIAMMEDRQETAFHRHLAYATRDHLSLMHTVHSYISLSLSIYICTSSGHDSEA